MRYDAAVIGAGPAGSFAAFELSSQGHKTLIIDPCNKKKVCSGVITAQYGRRYGIDEALIEKELKGIRISFRNLSAEITYKKAVEFSINRESYDAFNLDQAVGAGCELRKELVLLIDEKDSHVEIKTGKEYILADYAIVASGVSELSSSLGGSKKYAFCVQQKKEQKQEDYFEMELQKGGYSWIVPKKDYVLSGTSSLRDYPDIPGEKGLIPVGGPVKKTFSRRTLLAGDAAGFVSPFEGEGIYYARRSGEIAAEVVSGAISGRNTPEDYEKRWKKEFDFSILAGLSLLLSNEMVLEAFVREIRDNERFNKLVEDILTKENKFQKKDI
jgi:geranylgeranyl reductase